MHGSRIELDVDAHDLAVTYRALRRLADDPDEEIAARVTARQMQERLSVAVLRAIRTEIKDMVREYTDCDSRIFACLPYKQE